jgi:hypothetical protein
LRTGICSLTGVVVLAASASAGPLEANLKLLRDRSKAGKPAPTANPARAPRRPHARMGRSASAREPILAAGSPLVTYGGERFGSKTRGGDLVVKTSGAKGATHVYIKQRLVSSEGSGEAHVPDLAPGKVPVLVWAPESGKRRTFWVAVRPGTVAQLDARL